MAKINHVAKFNSSAHRETVEKMRARREEVHAKGKEEFLRTGKMSDLVSIRNGAKRKSKFAFTRNADGTFTLVHGPKIPHSFNTDGTGSFGSNVGRAFEAAPKIYGMLESHHGTKAQMDFSFGVFQDRDDRHDVIQIPQFESDNKFAEHMRLLVPDHSGGDMPEDYDLGIWYAANCIEADINHYGGKGYFVLLLDAPGRGTIQPSLIRNHLGVEGVQSEIQTRDVWQDLLNKFHAFVVVFGSAQISRWWEPIVGKGHMIQADSAEFFAEIQAGLVYVTGNLNPTVEGLYEFFRAGQGSTITMEQTRKIWNSYVRAEVEFGADAKLGIELPKPGDTFQNMTDLWPIGHPRASENPTPGLVDSADSSDASDSPPAKPIDWSRF